MARRPPQRMGRPLPLLRCALRRSGPVWISGPIWMSGPSIYNKYPWTWVDLEPNRTSSSSSWLGMESMARPPAPSSTTATVRPWPRIPPAIRRSQFIPRTWRSHPAASMSCSSTYPYDAMTTTLLDHRSNWLATAAAVSFILQLRHRRSMVSSCTSTRLVSSTRSRNWARRSPHRTGQHGPLMNMPLIMLSFPTWRHTATTTAMTTTAVTTTAMTTTAVTSNLLSATRNPIPAIPIDDAFRPPISFGCIWRLNRKTKTPNWTLMNTNIDETVGHARAKHRSCLLFCGGVFFALVLALFSAAPAQAATFALGTTSLLVGPTAGTNSVVLAATPATATWTASTNATWLHLSAANQSGTGSTNVIFGWDPNPGPTRTGSLTVAGRTLTITQAGSTYVQEPGPVTALADSLSGGGAIGLAVDGTGNVYVAESSHYYIDKWIAVSNTTIALVSASYGPYGVAVDGAGNVY